jgi:L-threonylcarbamoyladenylate synthase
VRASLGDQVDFVLDGGPCRVGVESTVLSLTGKEPTLLRPGGVSLEELQAIVGKVAVVSGPVATPQAPGQLESHYAPNTPLVLAGPGQAPPAGKKTGLLSLKGPEDASFVAVETLSPKGDLKEAAANLFAAMRRLDSLGLDLIWARPFPEEGLGRAINDRLRRAAHP